MKLRRLTPFLLLLASCGSDPYLYKDPSQPTEKRVESLLSQMTLDEKIDQLTMLVMGKNDNINNTEDREGRKLTAETGSFIYFGTDVANCNELQRRAMEESRLGIPAILGHDVIHGYRTLFPMPLAQACSWDTQMAYESSRVAARESYLSGVRWTFSPMLDVARDGRWGRVAESYGEDPYTNSQFARAVVSGYQGDKLSDEYSIASCLKHFAGYAYSQSGRDYNPTDVSDLSLWETVLPPFKAAVEAGAVTVMSSFNDLNGVPTVANRFLLTEVLRERLKFDGFVVSDWRAIEQLITQRYAADSLDASVKAIKAGNDMDMYDYLYKRKLPAAVEGGILDEKVIDEAVRRVLKVKFDLGLFENPYTPEVADSVRYMTPQAVALSRQMAEESMVLLKNDGVLPLAPAVKNILLVGVMIKDQDNMMGTWRSHAQKSDVTTIYDAIHSEFGSRAKIDFVEGSGLLKTDDKLLSTLRRKGTRSDVIVVALGEQYSWSGENGAKASLKLPEAQQKIVIEAKKCGKPVVLLTSSGRPLVLTDVEPHADAIVQMWQPGLFGGDAVAGILSGRVNPSAKLAITFPYSTGQIPIFYNHRDNARRAWGGIQGKYRDCPITPLYDFGHGLSYSTFEYGEIFLSKSEFTRGERITASVDVKNVSEVDGKEVLLWYVDDPLASTTQPLRKLKYFEKRMIAAGETERFTFEIDPLRDLSFVDAKGQDILESGEFFIEVAGRRAKLNLR